MIKRPSIFNLVAGLNLVRAARAVKISIMLQYSLSRLALISCSVSLAFLTVACNQDQQKKVLFVVHCVQQKKISNSNTCSTIIRFYTPILLYI
jgi:hypothetical protein